MFKLTRNIIAAGIAGSSVLLASQAFSADATNNATATVIDPIEITAGAVLDFGSFAASAAGDVVMGADGTRSSTGPVLVTAENGAAASFDVSGTPDMAYSITLPTSDVTLSDGELIGESTMTMSSFTASEALDGSAVLDGSGAANFTVGASLAVSAGQAPGVYTGQFSVTVDYN